MTDVISLQDRRPGPKGLIALTPTAALINELADECQGTPALGILVGPSGCGKSAALKAFAAENDEVIYYHAPTIKGQLKPMIKALAERTGAFLKGNEATDDLYNKVVQYLGGGLWKKKKKKLLMVDEAQSLDFDALSGVCDIREEADCGLLLSGNPELIEHIERSGERARGHARLRNRAVGTIRSLAEPLPEDLSAIFDFYGLTGEARKLAAKVCRLNGWLHSLDVFLKKAQRAAGQGQPVQIEHYRRAAASFRVA